ncbi:MAG: TfoX/Sxy family protein [Gemmatimonadetes bacterium]|nr:TfoX/Sxy family protein [Gemmatimonadota bacterium]
MHVRVLVHVHGFSVSYDSGLLQRCLDALAALHAAPVRHRNVFGMRGLMRGKKMFAAVGDESMIVRLLDAEYAGALARAGVRAFTPGGSKLGTWVEVDDSIIADDPELREWLEAGLRSLE